jgi:hypothetical protein
VSPHETGKLYTLIKPLLQEVLQSISLREISFSDVIAEPSTGQMCISSFSTTNTKGTSDSSQ